MTVTSHRDVRPPAQQSLGDAGPSGAGGRGHGAGPGEPPAGPPERTASRRDPVLASLAASLLLLAALLLGFAGWVALLSGVQHQRTQDTLYDDFREELAQATAPVSGPILPGRPVAVLEVPGLRLREVVLEGTTGGELLAGPGHRRDTALPGQPGVCVLLGRRAAAGGPFRDLTALRPGDPLRLVTGQGVHVYRVDGVRRPGDPLPSPVGAGSRLTLVTSERVYRPESAVYLDATLVSPQVPASRSSVAVEGDERNLAAEPGALVPLLLWAQLLLLVALGAAWGYRSWGRWQTHLVAVPVLLAVLWNVYECVLRLLPNTL